MSIARSNAPILSVGGGLGADHGATGEGGELDPHGTIVLAGVALLLDLDVHPHDAMIVLLQPGQLLRYVTAEPIRHLAVPARDHDLHVNLPYVDDDGRGGRTRDRAPWHGVRPADLVFVPTTAC